MNPTKSVLDFFTSIKNNLMSLKLSYVALFSVVLNFALAAALVRLWYGINSPTPVVSVVDSSEKVLAELKLNLEQLRSEHKKNLDEYNEQMKNVLQAYNTRLAELEIKREQTAKKIVEQHNGDVEGLAQDFSTTMRIPLGAKK